ncbi:hypothetical protein FOA52_006450 [Chlamydomonas sp. UWO 241]|nr:hypothetical protein FOA52_006450 [Chlamydomonas sp. UWO 241]
MLPRGQTRAPDAAAAVGAGAGAVAGAGSTTPALFMQLDLVARIGQLQGRYEQLDDCLEEERKRVDELVDCVDQLEDDDRADQLEARLEHERKRVDEKQVATMQQQMVRVHKQQVTRIRKLEVELHRRKQRVDCLEAELGICKEQLGQQRAREELEQQLAATQSAAAAAPLPTLLAIMHQQQQQQHPGHQGQRMRNMHGQGGGPARAPAVAAAPPAAKRRGMCIQSPSAAAMVASGAANKGPAPAVAASAPASTLAQPTRPVALQPAAQQHAMLQPMEQRPSALKAVEGAGSKRRRESGATGNTGSRCTRAHEQQMHALSAPSPAVGVTYGASVTAAESERRECAETEGRAGSATGSQHARETDVREVLPGWTWISPNTVKLICTPEKVRALAAVPLPEDLPTLILYESSDFPLRDLHLLEHCTEL